MKLLKRPFVQVLLILMAALIFASVMTKYFPLPPELLCMDYPNQAGCEKVSQSLYPDRQPPSALESFVGLWVGFWMMFFLIIYILPRKWGDAIWKVAFPFAPRKAIREDGPNDGENK